MEMMKNKLSTRIIVLLLTVTLFTTGLMACKDNTEKPEMSDKERIMSLMENSFFFSQAPEELYLGEAIQESFTDQGVTVKYLGAFSDGEGFFLFLDIIATDDEFFGRQDMGYTFAINEYDFFEKAGYTDSKMYQILDYKYTEEKQMATVCVEYIGLLEEDDISFHIYAMDGDMSKENNEIRGDWEIKFSIKESSAKSLEANKMVPYNGYEFLMQRAVISPVIITLFAARNDVPEEIKEMNTEQMDMKIIYKKDKKVGIPSEFGYAHGNQKGYMFRIKYTAENYEDIVGLEVNGVLFPVLEYKK